MRAGIGIFQAYFLILLCTLFQPVRYSWFWAVVFPAYVSFVVSGQCGQEVYHLGLSLSVNFCPLWLVRLIIFWFLDWFFFIIFWFRPCTLLYCHGTLSLGTVHPFLGIFAPHMWAPVFHLGSTLDTFLANFDCCLCEKVVCVKKSLCFLISVWVHLLVVTDVRSFTVTFEGVWHSP